MVAEKIMSEQTQKTNLEESAIVESDKKVSTTRLLFLDKLNYYACNKK
jgi:hypothetical protein